MEIAKQARKFGRETFATRGTGPWNNAAFSLLLALAAGAPLLYGLPPDMPRHAFGAGAMPHGGNALLAFFAFLLAALTSLSGLPLSVRRLTVPLGSMVGIVLLALFQLTPLPESVLRVIAPVNLIIYHETAEILGFFRQSPTPAPRISIAPSETLQVLLLLLAFTALFLSSAHLLSTRNRRRLFVGILLSSSLIHVVLATFQKPSNKRLQGALRNADHFAGYLEIVLAVAFGLLWAEVLRSSERARHVPDRADRFERRFLPMAWRILLWGVVAVGLVLTRSRGAILAAGFTTATLLTLGLLHTRVKRRRGTAATASVALLLGILFVGAATGASPFSRFLQLDPRDLSSNTRVTLWKTSLLAWEQFPFLGSGLGTFREAFRRVQPRELSGLVEHAHSDFLQLLVTGGVIGAALAVVLFTSLFVLLLQAWSSQRHREESALVLAGFGALLSLTLHGLLEFNLSIPVIPATLACVLGCSWAAGRRR